MKPHALIILLAIAASIVIPPSFPMMSDHGATTEIGMLDVCHAATPAVSSNGDMPCVHEVQNTQLPSPEIVMSGSSISSFTQFLLSYQDERPPKA